MNYYCFFVPAVNYLDLLACRDRQANRQVMNSRHLTIGSGQHSNPANNTRRIKPLHQPPSHRSRPDSTPRTLLPSPVDLSIEAEHWRLRMQHGIRPS